MAKHNRFIDLAKGLAALMVLITHYRFTFAEKLDYWFPFWISAAVPIFMFFIGYLSARSFSAKGCKTLKALYRPGDLAKKIIRYALPFLCFFAVELLLETWYLRQPNLKETLDNLTVGGFGVHGTYFFPVLLQITLITPLIYYIVNRWKKGIFICFAFNLAFEFWKTHTGMASEDYRLCALRYVFAVAIGCFACLYYKRGAKWNWVWIHMLEIGALYLWVINYTSYRARIFTNWQSTSMLAMLFFAPLLVFGLDYLSNWHFKPLELMGKASFHIFFVQIVYYNYFAEKVYFHIANKWLELGIGVALCIIGGLAFYYFCNIVRSVYLKLTSPKKA